MIKKPRGYLERILFIDCETSGLFPGDDPSYDSVQNKAYQAVSWGLIVADANSLKPLEELYLEIKWDGESLWSKEAQRIHGLSLEYLEKNGIESEEATIEIATLILKHWGPDSPVSVAGHNVATFDLPFLKRQLRKHGIDGQKFGAKHIDTNSAGFSTFGTHNSDDLFLEVGCPPRDPHNHNALDDARNALHTVKTIRSLFQRCIGG